MGSGELAFCFVEHGTSAYEETVAVRSRILREPLGLVFSCEEIAGEINDSHLAAYRRDELVACLVLSPERSGVWRMRQVAVVESARGQGVGAALVADSERRALEHGVRRMELHAREPVVGFYEKRGYRAVGPTFLELGIPHRKMGKNLGNIAGS